jgi:hypothetical protein
VQRLLARGGQYREYSICEAESEPDGLSKVDSLIGDEEAAALREKARRRSPDKGSNIPVGKRLFPRSVVPLRLLRHLLALCVFGMASHWISFLCIYYLVTCIHCCSRLIL